MTADHEVLQTRITALRKRHRSEDRLGSSVRRIVLHREVEPDLERVARRSRPRGNHGRLRAPQPERITACPERSQDGEHERTALARTRRPNHVAGHGCLAWSHRRDRAFPSSDRRRRRWRATSIPYQSGLAGFYHPASLQARARVAELADARVLDARERKLFRVQVPALAPESSRPWPQPECMVASRAEGRGTCHGRFEAGRSASFKHCFEALASSGPKTRATAG